MKHIEECIDCSSEYGQKYLAIVSRDDTDVATQVHHIVPVAYFKDVLGIAECRKKGTPDMTPDNLVKLSVGKHILAHYYLMKCAKKCIKAQMVNAFMCTYKTTSVEGITEEDVIARMAEVDAEYATLKDGKRPHKDEIRISNGKNSHCVTKWLDGEKNGAYFVYDNDGRITELGKYGSSMKIRLRYFSDYSCIFGKYAKYYSTNELVTIDIAFDISSKLFGLLTIDSDGFFVQEVTKRGTRNSVHLCDYNGHSGRLDFRYEFKTSKFKSRDDGISIKDNDRVMAWVKKMSLSSEIYDTLASILDFIGTNKSICKNMYKNLADNHVLKELSSRAYEKSNVITEILSTLHEYVSDGVIPVELNIAA